MIVHRDYKAIVAFNLKMYVFQRRIATERDAAKSCGKSVRDDITLATASKKNSPNDIRIST